MAEIRLGLVGTGFIARHLAMSVARQEGFRISRILTRRELDSVSGFDSSALIKSPDELVDSEIDVIVECSGDPLWATDVVARAVEANVPVVTMNTEFHITSGSAFVGKGIVTEAEGDQPGCLASLHEEAVAMGFSPVVYGNMKGFLNQNPTPEEMEYWGEKQGISLPMVTSFTDGTKVQAEQILVANHFGATIATEGMLAPDVSGIEESAEVLAAAYEDTGRPISDFVVGGGLPHGVFIVATHDEQQADALAYYKLGEGPYYTLIRNNIFVHLEILKTVRRVLERGEVLLDNSAIPELSLATVAKQNIAKGTKLESGIGSFDLRGHAIRTEDHPDHVPIGLIKEAESTRDIAQGEIVVFDDLELPESLALSLWNESISPSLNG